MKIIRFLLFIIILPIFWAVNFELVGSPSPHLNKIGLKYSCIECHKIVKKNGLNNFRFEHGNILVKHADLKCNDCHAGLFLDRLRLKTGRFVKFKQSAEFCLDCHDDLKSDWIKV